MRGNKVATPEKQWKQTIQIPYEGHQGKVQNLERRCGQKLTIMFKSSLPAIHEQSQNRWSTPLPLGRESKERSLARCSGLLLKMISLFRLNGNH